MQRTFETRCFVFAFGYSPWAGGGYSLRQIQERSMNENEEENNQIGNSPSLRVAAFQAEAAEAILDFGR